MTSADASQPNDRSNNRALVSPDWAEIIELSPVATMVVACPIAGRAEELGRIAYANERARTLFDSVSRPNLAQRLTKRSILDFIDGAHTPETTKLLARAADPLAWSDTDATRHVLVTNGSLRPMTVHVRPVSEQRAVVQLVDRTEAHAIDQVLSEQQRFRSALMELSELAHRAYDDADFYQRLLERAVEVVPGAQGGSVQLKIPGSTAFRFVAAVGYDLAGLQEQVLEQGHFFRDAWDPNARILHDFDNAGRSAEIADWLLTTGRLNEIEVNVSAPVLSEGFPVAFLSLDNFEDRGAMTETSVEMTTVLSRLIGELWQRRELEAQLRREREAFRHLALHDPLTGLANRRNLERSLSEAMAGARRRHRSTSVLFVDIDDFKGVNDRLGHEVGDQLLVAVARGLSDVVRTGDMVGRWGGDEFLVLPGRLESSDGALELANRILQRFATDIELDNGLWYRARLTIGVASSDASKIDVDGLVRSADEALYEAKAAGKGTARFRAVR